MRKDSTSPTDVIVGWIPHDARWHEAARSAAVTSTAAVRQYVSGLVNDHRDSERNLDDPFDVASIDAVREDLGALGLDDVDWGQVRGALLVPLRVRGLV